MASGPILPGEDDTLFQEPILNGDEPVEELGTGTALGEMDPEDFQALVSAGIEASENYIDTWLSPARETAGRYYHAEKFGNEVEGRSEIVVSEVRDGVLAMMPGILRVFAGTTEPVEFEANPATPSEQAEQQTRYVSHVIFRDNPGFEILHDAVKDALVRKTGIFTWWWEERELVTATRFSDLPDQALMLLEMEATDQSDADVGLEYEVQVEDQTPDNSQPLGDMVPDILRDADPAMVEEVTGAPPPMLSSGVLRRRMIRKRVRVAAVPPEEFICTPQNTRDLDRFNIIGRRQELTIGEIVALGHDEEEIREAIGGSGGTGSSLAENPEAIARNDGANVERLFDSGFAAQDPASELVKYVVVYVLVDFDGDGILERRKVVTVGGSNVVIYNELHDDDMVPYGTICPDPEAHSPFGGSAADWMMDLQEVNSELLRGTLDSLSESITSRTAINKRNVNIDDALNTARGAIVRVDGVPAENIYELSKPFVGANTLPVLQYLQEMKTRRTGINPASPSGLDMDALQSTAKEGVQAAVDTANDRLEMICRIFAETGVSRLYRGVRNLVCRHQDFRRTLRLMGTPAIIDPRTWTADLDLVVKAGVGRGMGAKRLQGLTFMAAQQKEILTSFGLQNGVVEIKHFAYTLQEMAKELGFADPTRFANAYTPEMEEKARKIQEARENAPTPEMLLYKAQTQKTEMEFQAKMAALAAKRDDSIRADATRRAQANTTFALGAAKLLGEYGRMVEAQAVQLRGEDTDNANRLADDLNADTPAQPVPLPKPPEPAKPNEGGSNVPAE
jgi:hypothetical protein